MRRGSIHKARADEGAILITVMLTVAIMATVAVVILEQIQFSVSVTLNGEQADQTRWAALGMEDWAQGQLMEWKLAAAAEEGSIVPTAADASLTLGGLALESKLAPLGNCFNLNSLIAPTVEGGLATNEAAREGFINILTALGLSSYRATGLAAAAADWIDPDLMAQPSGAEDYEYSGLATPYRTGNVPFADASELRAVKGFDRETYLLVRPFVCALPHFESNPINLNSLTREEAPLLALVFKESPMRSAVDLILARRPMEGFVDTEALFADPDLTALKREDADQELLALRSRFFIVETAAKGADTKTEMHTIFDTQTGTRPTVVRRYFGERP